MEDIEPLRSGDIVRLNGVLYTARDAAHARMKDAIEADEPLPFDPEGQVVYYGPGSSASGSSAGTCGTDDGIEDGPALADARRTWSEGHGRQGSRSDSVLEP